MGTSQAARAPTTKNWVKLVPSALKSPTRNPVTISDAILSSTIPLLLPTGLVTGSISFVSSVTINFFNDCKSVGLKNTIEKSFIEISSSYLVPSISKGLWNIITEKLDPQIATSPYGKLAEHSLRKTLTSIMLKGTNDVIAHDKINNIDHVQNNINNFGESFGETGLLKSFFTNYLFDITKYFLETQDVSNRENDPGHLFHFNLKGKPYSVQDTDKLLTGLENECGKYASKIIEKIKESSNKSIFTSDPLVSEFDSLLKDVFQKVVTKVED